MTDDETQNKENNIQIKKLPNSEVEIEGEIPADEFESYYKKTVQKLGKDAELPGFRKGHVPENVLVEKLGENAVLHEMANMALANVYPKFIIENKIEAIGKPEITITKIARNNPLGFKAKTAVLPEFELSDYESIAAKAVSNTDEDILVTDEDIAGVIEQIRKSRQQSQAYADFTQTGAGEGKENSDGAILGADGQPLAQKHENTEAQKQNELPELTDEFVKQLGDFENIADFKKKIRENLIHEKTAKAKDKKRIAIIDGILEKTSILLPSILIESELDRMLARFKNNISAMGHTFEDYLKQIKKTETETREGWRKDAEKSVKTQLILQKIAETEKIKVPEVELDKEVEHITKHHPDADKERARQYVEGMLLHEKVFQFLEREEKADNLPK
ncbi:hypothetical protein CL630_01905 [bacterium]|nr:hypothetical protein [bacterium]|tara:strand:+ start:1895 stop:3067 length:1173 start_codon:yes stop_codon:yes gene_type:complete